MLKVVDLLDNKIIMLLIAIIAIWILVNPASRDFIKTKTGALFGATPVVEEWLGLWLVVFWVCCMGRLLRP